MSDEDNTQTANEGGEEVEDKEEEQEHMNGGSQDNNDANDKQEDQNDIDEDDDGSSDDEGEEEEDNKKESKQDGEKKKKKRRRSTKPISNTLLRKSIVMKRFKRKYARHAGPEVTCGTSKPFVAALTQFLDNDMANLFEMAGLVRGDKAGISTDDVHLARVLKHERGVVPLAM